MMKPAELREKSVLELKEILSSSLREHFKLRLIKGSGELTEVHKIRDARRAIARVQTILAQKQGDAK